MDKLVIGITGRRGSGKDTIAEHLRSRHGFISLDFTRDVLAPMLEERRLPVTRQNLISLAMDGRKRSGNGVWAEKIAGIIEEKRGARFVISGVRFPEEVDIFRKRFGKGFILLAVECGDRLRYERLLSRGTKGEGAMSYEDFLGIERKPTEKAVDDTLRLADTTVDNSRGLDELYSNVDDAMTKIR